MSVSFEKIEAHGQNISLENGKWAKQAHGSVVYRADNLVLLATVCAEKEAKEGQSFFPLTVDYREKFYAAGLFPGGYFKRETRPAEHETLMSRLIDRPCRPLFPEGYLCEVQLLITLLSYDPKQAVEGHAITAASAALMSSDIPWDGPIAGVLVGRVDGAFVIDPDLKTREKSDLELLVAGSKEAITMIEGSAKEYSNEEMVEALDFAHKALAHKLEVQSQFAAACAVEKRDVELKLPDKALMREVHDFAYSKIQSANQTKGKVERDAAVQEIEKEALLRFENKLQESGSDAKLIAEHLKDIKTELHNIEYLVVRSLIFEKGIRADGRKLEEIREIDVQMDVLPGAHGSAVFTRGQTQSLGVLTLGAKMDNQRYDTLDGQQLRNFMLHYNFPPFSTGEVKRMIGPGRREVGHGNLAWRAIKQVLPPESEFPYVIRLVSEILESNGSSSMASVCSASLALMAGGVPLSGAVAGIAMGLMSDEKANTAILSDIAGLEDHFGDMDLKVAGTQKGITAFQLDLKVQGLDLALITKALEQAKEGRLHILEEMNKACSKPRESVPDSAPRITTLSIDTSRIGELIGPGGRIIRDIIERSGAEVNVEDDGTVTIASPSGASNEAARKMIEDIFREVEAGASYDGIIKRIVDFGAFVELYPGKEGLLHISKMSERRLASVEEMFQEGDSVPVVVLGVDRAGKVDLCHRDVPVNSNTRFSHKSHDSGHSHRPARPPFRDRGAREGRHGHGRGAPRDRFDRRSSRPSRDHARGGRHHFDS